MRKFTGKAVSLVLALALTVSSFSGTFAFAATKTINAYDVTLGNDDDIAMVKDSNNEYYKLLPRIENITLKYVDDREKKSESIGSTSDDTKVTVRHSSGDSLVSFKSVGSDDEPAMRVKKDKTGKEVVTVYAQTKVDLEDGTEAVVKGSYDLTLKVISTEDRFVTVIGTLDENNAVQPITVVKDNNTLTTAIDEDGTVLPTKFDKGSIVPISVKKDIPANINVTADDDTKYAVAVVKAVSKNSKDGDPTPVYKISEKNDGDKDFIYIEGNDNGNSKVALINDDFKLAGKDTGLNKVIGFQNTGKGSGSLKLDVKTVKENNGSYKNDKTEQSTTVEILKAVKVASGSDAVVAKESGKAKITANALAGAYLKDSNLNGYSFYSDGTASITFKENVSAGKVDNFSDVTVTDGAKVGDVKHVANSVKIEDEDSSVGVIDIDGDVELTEGRVTSIEAGNVTINGGTVNGNVQAGDNDGKADSDKELKISATDDDINTVISGTASAKIVKVDSDTDAIVTVDKIQLYDDGEIDLDGENVTIKTLDAGYEGDVKFDDFQGTINSLVQPDEVTATEDTKAIIKGDVVATSIDIDEDGSLEFTGKLTVDSLSGDGKLTVPADSLMINEDASSDLILKLSGNDVKIGDVAYRADKEASVDVDSLNGFGFNVEKKSENKNTNTFLVKNVEFAGVALDKTAVEIAKDYSNTVTVSNYPASTSLPAGAKVEWDYSDADKDVFEVTENGATVTIKVVGFDSKYATSNEFDLTATVVDANGDVLEDYDEATATIKAVAEPKFSSDLNGIVEVPQGSVKNFNFTSDILSTPSVGNSAVAVTGTVKAYADGKATYAVKAVGAVGTTTGVYANYGAFTKQIFTVKVTAPKVTVDTTVDFALAKGNRYVYKVTAPAAPVFTVGNGAVIKTQAGKVAGNDYYFSVYAVGTVGQSTGVYVNGVKVNTITVK